MTEQPKPLADPRPSSAASGAGERGASPNAFDFWLRGALHQLFGSVLDEPVPEALRRLAAREAPPAHETPGNPPPV